MKRRFASSFLVAAVLFLADTLAGFQPAAADQTAPAPPSSEPAASGPLTPDQRQEVERIIHDYLLKNPELMMEVLDAAEQQHKEQEAQRSSQTIAAKRDELLNDPAAPIGGNPKGDVTIVEFFDYQCPYCKQVEPVIEALVKSDPKVRIVYKEFPILGPESHVASHVAFAALKQGPEQYIKVHNALLGAKGHLTDEAIMQIADDAGLDMTKLKADMAAPEIETALKKNYDLAVALGIEGTPAFIVGDALAPGALDADTLRAMIAEARKHG